jgi:type IV pilus assembly protein PilA
MIRKIRKQLRKNRGFTLVELMIVVAIVGILAALAIYGVRKYMANAKTAEARNGIGQMGKDAITAYFKEGMEATIVALTKSTSVVNKICDGAGIKGVPGELTKDSGKAHASVAAKKYQSSPSDWETWDCLHWSMNDPQYYVYDYLSSTGDLSADGATFQCLAAGDLDGDSEGSQFSILGAIQTDAKGVKTATLAPNIEERSPDE